MDTKDSDNPVNNVINGDNCYAGTDLANSSFVEEKVSDEDERLSIIDYLCKCKGNYNGKTN